MVLVNFGRARKKYMENLKEKCKDQPIKQQISISPKASQF